MTWLGTPYHHQAHVKGHGVDCVWLLIEVYKKVGIVDADLDPGNYSREWYFHRSEEIYMGGVERYAHRIETPRPGDVALYKYGRCVSHGAILLGDGFLIHANRRVGKVERCDLATMAPHLHSYWSCIK